MYSAKCAAAPKVLVAPVVGLALTGYFAYHLVEARSRLAGVDAPDAGIAASAKTGLADCRGRARQLERRAVQYGGPIISTATSSIIRSAACSISPAPDEIVIIQPQKPR
jgi:hypothetical protein